MATRTINKPTDLSLEELFERSSKTRSKLPVVLLEIAAQAKVAAGGLPAGRFLQSESAIAALAGTDTGIKVYRRRTRSSDAPGEGATAGIRDATDVARLISKANFDRLTRAAFGVSGPGYDGSHAGAPLGANTPFVNPPTMKITTVDAHTFTTKIEDYLDIVSGVNNSSQAFGSGDKPSGRAAKIDASGTGVRTRTFSERAADSATPTLNVKTTRGDRLGGGVVGFPSLPTVHVLDSQGRAVGATGTSYDFSSGDRVLAFTYEGTSVTVTFAQSVLTAQQVVDAINARIAELENTIPGQNDPVFGAVAELEPNGAVVIRSRTLGTGATITITDDITALGLTAGDNITNGATAGGATFTNNELITLAGTARNAKTNITYSTVQFGVVAIKQTTNDANPVAYLISTQHLADLVGHHKP